MNKFFGVLFTFIAFALFTETASAGMSAKDQKGEWEKACARGHKEYCGEPGKIARNTSKPVYSEVLGYAKNPAITPLAQGSCSGDGQMMGVTNENSWCKDYNDRNGEKWRAVFNARTTDLRILIRLSDNSSVAFNERGEVTANNIKPRSSAQTQEARKEKTEPVQEAQKIDPTDIAKKALGTIFKGF